MSDRHSRQTRLREIGQAGQRRIGAATVVVASRGVAAEIEARYLAGAGFARVVTPDDSPAAAAVAVDPSVVVEARAAADAAEAMPFDVTDPSARAIADGAYRALVAIRATLGSTSE